MFQDELPDYHYFYYYDLLEKDAKRKLMAQAEAEQDAEPYEHSMLTALCAASSFGSETTKPAVRYHQNAINPTELQQMDQRSQGLRGKGKRLLSAFKSAIPNPSSETFGRKRV